MHFAYHISCSTYVCVSTPQRFMNLRDSPNLTKKVWRPQLRRSPSVISVVANNRTKVCRKQQYSLKMGDICMPGERKFSSDGSGATTPSSVASKVEKSRRYCTTSKSATFQFVINGREVSECGDHLQQTLEFRQKRIRTVKIVKNERKLARKVYLRWSKYCVSRYESEYEQGDRCGNQFDEQPFAEVVEGREKIASLRRRYLAKKYWLRWRAFAKTNKAAGDSSKRKFRDEKNVAARREDDGAKRVIEAQKRKIEEQANLINELELIRAKLEDEKFTGETDRMLQECAIEYEKTTKSKAQYLRTYSLPSARKYDEWHLFVTRMEARASERKKRWDDIRKRKQELEEERVRKLKMEEEKRQKLEEEAKKRKIIEMRREKRRLEELRKRQQEERIHMGKLNEMAKLHNDDRLLRTGLSALVRFAKEEKLKAKDADYYYNRTALMQMFGRWKLLLKLEQRKRIDRAEEFYENSLMRKAFGCLKSIHREYVRNAQVAADFYDFCLQKNCLYKWQLYSLKCKYEFEKRENSANDYYELGLLRNSFENWQKLPRVRFLEREKEQRIRLWCYKVQELLPDFRPSFQCF